mmetsp:Transcript_16723/g.30866  ORF Transcript_16723/g.30866 Transcript_16723/m.30866 type:complete len:500 (-) Transcript_16723:28-1527(-)
MQRLTPKQVIQETTAQYGILWEAGKDKIVPLEVYGNHSFLDVSKSWKFSFGEGCVGRAYARHETIVVEDVVSGHHIFLRRGDAEKCGIHTIVFIPQETGSVLEVGFDQKLEQLPKSWWMNSILDMCSSTDGESFETQSMQRLRTPSPDWLARCRMVGASVDESAQFPMTRPPSALRAYPGVASPSLQTWVRVVPLPLAEPTCGTPVARRNDVAQVHVAFLPRDADGLKSIGSTNRSSNRLTVEEHACRIVDTGDCEYGPECQMCYDLSQHQSEVKVRSAQTKTAKSKKNQKEPSNAMLAEVPLPPLSAESEPAWLEVQHDKSRASSSVTSSSVTSGDLEEQKGPRVQLTLASSLAFEQDPMPSDHSQEGNQKGTQFLQPPGMPSLNFPAVYPPVFSAGSVGHPYSCGGACKYQKTQKGCKLGAACNRCHLCFWTRASERALNSSKQVISSGSVGHPFWCGGACKAYTQKVCKAGVDCKRCHLCTWARPRVFATAPGTWA